MADMRLVYHLHLRKFRYDSLRRRHAQFRFQILLTTNIHTHLVFLQKFRGQSPRCISQDFINVAAVSQGLVTFHLRHDCETFVLMGQLVAAHWSKRRDIELPDGSARVIPSWGF